MSDEEEVWLRGDDPQEDARLERICKGVDAVLAKEGATGQGGRGVAVAWVLVAEWMLPDQPQDERWLTQTSPGHQSKMTNAGLLHVALYD